MTLAEILVRIGVDASRVASGISVAERTMERFGTRLFYMGARITAGVGAPVAAATAAIMKFGLEFDQAMTEAVAIMDGVTPEIRSRMESVAKGITETTKFSAAEGAKAFYDLASAGLDATGVIEGLPVVARFAQAGLMDLATAGEYLAGAQAALGDATANGTERVQEMARIADVLTKANNMALGTVENFAQALTNKAGQQMRIFNKDVEEGVAVLAAYASQNIRGAAAGTQLYMALRDLARFATKNAEAFKANNIAVFDSLGNMRNMADIIGDFEKRLEGASNKQAAFLFQQLGMTDRSRAATQALIGLSDNIRTYQAGLQETGTAQAVAAKQMESVQAQLKSLGNQFKVLAIDIFKEFEPVIREKVIPALRAVLDVGKDFLVWLRSLSTESKTAVAAVAGLAVALGPIMTFVGSWTLLVRAVSAPLAPLIGAAGQAAQAAGTSMGAAATNVGLLSRAWGVLAGAGRALITPLGLTVGVIGAVVLALKTLAGSWSNFFKLIEPGIPPITMLKVAWRELGEVWDRLSPTIKSLLGLIKEMALAMGQELINNVKTFIGWMEKFVQLGVSAGEKFGSNILEFLDYFKIALELAFPQMRQFLDFWDKLGKSADIAAEKIRNARKWGEGGRDEFIPGPKGIDIQLGPDLFAAKGGPRVDFGKDFVSEMPRTPFGTLDLSPIATGPKVRDLPKPIIPNDLATGVEKQASIIERYKESIKNLEVAMKSAFKEHVPLSIIVEEFGTELETAARKSKIFGDDLPKNVKKAHDAMIAQDMAQFWRTQSEKTKSATDEIVQAIGSTAQTPDMSGMFKAFGEAGTKIIEMQTRLDQARMHGTQLELAQIAQKRQAEIQAVEASVGLTQSQKSRQIKLIEDFYDREAKLAKGSADTLIDRMREAGVKTENELARMSRESQKTFEQMREHNKTAADGMKFEAEEVRKAWERWYDAMKKPNPLIAQFENIHKGLGPLVEAFRNLSDVAGESGVGAFATAMGQLITSFDLTVQAGGRVMQAIEGIDKAMEMQAAGVEGWGSKMVENMIGLASGIVSGISGIMAATSQGPAGQRIAGGALSGAATGAATAAGIAAIAGASAKGAAVAGVWGAAAGAIVGIFIAVFRGRGTRRLMEKVGEEWGQAISEGTAKTIERMMKSEGLGDVEAALLNMKDVISEAGGVNVTNLDKFTGKMRDVFVSLQAEALTTAQATKILEENFGNIAQAVVATGRVASKEFLDIIRLTKEFGLEVKAVTEFIEAQGGRFGTAMEQVIAGTAEPFAGLAAKIKEAREELERLNTEGASNAEIVAAQNTLNNLLALQAYHVENTSGHLDRMAFVLLSGFNAGLQSGGSVISLLTSMGPAIDTLINSYTDLGLTSDNAAVQQLTAMRTLMNENPALIAGIGALSEAFLSLSLMGGLNIETFNAMQTQGMAMYHQLSERAHALGLDQSMAIQMMVPFLKAVLSANEEYGFSIDENTQGLINQAREMGLIKEEQLDTNEILMQGLGAIIEALGGELPEAFRNAARVGQEAFQDVGNEAIAQLHDIQNEFRAFDPGEIVVPYRFEQVGDSPTIDAAAMDVPELAAGGVVRKATLAVVGEKGPEVVTPLNESMNWLHQNREDDSSGDVILDGKRVGKYVSKRQARTLRNKGVR